VLFERIFCVPLKIYHGLSFFFLVHFSSFFLERRKKNERRKTFRIYSNICLNQTLIYTSNTPINQNLKKLKIKIYNKTQKEK